MSGRGPDPGGGLEDLSGNSQRKGRREDWPRTSCEASVVHLPYDSSTDSDMGEEFDPQAVGGWSSIKDVVGAKGTKD